MHVPIDLRSDTVTRPGNAMREAMMRAEVGDDVYEDDPSVNVLQQKAAEITGKEAALFTASGTMSNAIALKTHVRPGEEVLLDSEAHSMIYELGMPATLALALTRQFQSVQGIPDVRQIAGSFHQESLHTPRTSLLVLENTHNRAGGAIIPLEIHRTLYELAHAHGAAVHLDGARIFNASVATGIPVCEFARYTDTITFCLSKGLGCPVGSLLCGSAQWIKQARRNRKMLGGGMRQVGFLAAAGLYALEHNIARLKEDHQRIRTLAEAVAQMKGIQPDSAAPPTNILYCTTETSAEALCTRLQAEYGILCNAMSANRVRFVAHIDIDDDDIMHTIKALQELC